MRAARLASGAVMSALLALAACGDGSVVTIPGPSTVVVETPKRDGPWEDAEKRSREMAARICADTGRKAERRQADRIDARDGWLYGRRAELRAVYQCKPA